MADRDPGDRSEPAEARARRVLERPPAERYARSLDEDGRAPDGSDTEPPRSALAGPLIRALAAGAAGAGALVVIGAVFASTVGLLFISGAVGATVGLVLARVAVTPNVARAVSRRTVTWLALAVTLVAIAVAFVATWLYARSEGGTLGLLEYLFTTFGPFVPGQLVIGSVAAAWGANAGPVQR